jgi:hypothetical protein
MFRIVNKFQILLKTLESKNLVLFLTKKQNKSILQCLLKT